MSVLNLKCSPDLLELKINFFSTKVQAGFPSPADDYKEDGLDLNKYLIKHPAATFFVRAIGDSMIGAGIFPNDILIVDRSLKATSGKIVIAILDGQFTVKKILKKNGKIFLMAENEKYSPIVINEDSQMEIWGVVVHVIHSV